MIKEGEQRPNLVALYNRYSREEALATAWFSGIALTDIALAILLWQTHLHVTPEGGSYLETLTKLGIAVGVLDVVIGTEAATGFVLRKRHKSRLAQVELQIADAEGRIPDKSNGKRIRYTDTLASTLVYGVRVRTSRWGRFIDRFTRPYWEIYLGLNSVPPEMRKDATFAVFDLAVNALPFSEWDQREVGIASLNLAKQRWERIAEGKGSSRLRSYSYVMLEEINRRLGDAPPK